MDDKEGFSNEIWAYALKNAIEFGKTNAGVVIPKLFQHGLEKDKIKDVIPEINKIVSEVNKMSKEERGSKLKSYEKYAIQHEQKEKDLPELQNVGKKPVFRLAPFPSGALHIGNARTYLLNAIYSERYDGKTLLVMDDTIGSSEKPIAPDAYKLIEESFKWLGVKYAKPVIYKSDRVKIYYDYALQLIEKDKAYVCHCSQSDFKKLKDSGKDCPCRNIEIKKQLERWKKLFKMKEGSAVLRLKTGMQNPNPAFRDRVLFKISDREHPRVKKKYRVWPTLEMSWAVDDHLLGITHIIRGNDLVMETQVEKFIWDIFGWEKPEVIHNGLIRLEGVGAKISKSKAQKEVKSGLFIGWDDPRTWSMQSLERRGFKPEAMREFVKEIGLTKQDVVVPIESFYAINRKMIDSSADRYSFVENPEELELYKAPKIGFVSVGVHHDKKETRKIAIDKIFVSKKDLNSFKGKEVRLIHLFNVFLDSYGVGKFLSIENKDIPKINWVSDGLKTKILMPDGSWISGLAENAISKLKPGSIIQFERFGFVRFDGKKKDKKDEAYEFWFAHR